MKDIKEYFNTKKEFRLLVKLFIERWYEIVKYCQLDSQGKKYLGYISLETFIHQKTFFLNKKGIEYIMSISENEKEIIQKTMNRMTDINYFLEIKQWEIYDDEDYELE
jgi:hypothetical protein